MGSSRSGGNVGNTRGSRDNGFPTTSRGHTTEMHKGKQGKHIPGHNNYRPGKSIINGGLQAAQDLIIEGAGKGVWHEPNKETVDYGRIIGTYVDSNGNRFDTTVGTIHYSKTGAHIVPSRPKNTR